MKTDPSCVPTIADVLADPAASFWLKNALKTALARDPVDAANDAEMLLKLLDARLRILPEIASSRQNQRRK